MNQAKTEEVICEVCKKKFIRYLKKRRGRKRVIARPLNCITCSKKCAFEYSKIKDVQRTRRLRWKKKNLKTI